MYLVISQNTPYRSWCRFRRSWAQEPRGSDQQSKSHAFSEIPYCVSGLTTSYLLWRTNGRRPKGSLFSALLRSFPAVRMTLSRAYNGSVEIYCGYWCACNHILCHLGFAILGCCGRGGITPYNYLGSQTRTFNYCGWNIRRDKFELLSLATSCNPAPLSERGALSI